jgi:hypothetical protein
MPHTRTIELDAQKEYAYRFTDKDQPTIVKCKVLSGAGTVTLYKIESTDGQEAKLPFGDSHFLALNPGNAFYVELTTTELKATWEIAFSGIGTFELELPNAFLSPKMRGKRIKLSKKHKTSLYSKF